MGTIVFVFVCCIILAGTLWSIINRVRHYAGRCPQPRCRSWIRWNDYRIDRRRYSKITIVTTTTVCHGCGDVTESATRYKQGVFFRKRIPESPNIPAH